MPQPDLLLIEDDEAIAELIVWHFAREGFSVRQTPDGEQALVLVEERVPDIVLLDWMIESLPGIEVCRRLRRNPEIGERADHHADRARRGRGPHPRAGNRRRRLCHQAVQPARTGRARIGGAPPPAPRAGGRAADLCRHRDWTRSAHKVIRNGQTVAMGPTEFRLLRHFMEHPGRVFSRGQLLDSVWGQDSDIELRTVDVHIRRLRKAINLPGTTDIIRTVRSAGYALDSGKSV